MASYEMAAEVEVDGVVEETLVGLTDSVLLVPTDEQTGDCSLSVFESGATFHDTLESSLASAGIGGDIMLDATNDGDGGGDDGSDGHGVATGEVTSHLTSGDLEALVNFQAELDRIGSGLPDSHDPSAHVEISVTNFDPEETEGAHVVVDDVHTTATYEEVEQGVIGSSTFETEGEAESVIESTVFTDDQIGLGPQEMCGDMLHNVVIESSIPSETVYEEAVEEMILSDIPSESAAMPPIVPAGLPITVPVSMNVASPVVVQTVTTPTKGTMAALPRNKPIYLMPQSSVAGTSTSAGEGVAPVNRLLFTSSGVSSGSMASATDAATSQLISRALMDAKTLPASMRGKFLAVTSAGGGGGGPIIAKVMIATSSSTGPTGTQTMTFAPCGALGPGGAQTVRLVTSSGHTTGTTTTAGRTYTLAPQQSLVSPGKTRFVTSLPTTPTKQIVVNKIALAQKTPAKITMIPVSIAKSPQKIAPAPLGSTQSMQKGVMVMTTVMGGTPTSSILTTVAKPGTTTASPSRLIFRQTAGQKSTTPRKGTVAALTQMNVTTGATANHVAVAVTNTTGTGSTVRVALPPSSAAPGSTLQTFQVPGSKMPYIRLVTATTASTTATAIAGTRSSALMSATVRPTALTAARSIAPVPVSVASQVRMAVPIAPANTAPLIGQPMVAAKQMTVGSHQRIFIPASSVAQMRPAGASGGTSTITVPASALAHLGSSIFTSGGNIVMVPAQYMAQLQAQGLTTATVTSSPSVSTIVSSSLSGVSTPQPIAVKSQASPLLLPAQPAPAPAASTTAAPATSLFASASFAPNDKSFISALGAPSGKQPVNGAQPDANGIRPRKPCNCTKSQCLKLYCDCFANGEFCHDCNCNNCSNNLEREEERQKAIKSCLERNPQAFHPKIGKTFQGMGKQIGRSRDGDIERRHNKGCNCKRSGCLKNYCECYEAKIMCSYMCKCVGCKNFAESADKKTLMHLADAADMRVQQQTAAKSKLSTHMMEPATRPPVGSASGERLPSSFITGAVVEATCQCLLAQAEEGRDMAEADVERRVIQEFGRCLLQIIDCASKTKV